MQEEQRQCLGEGLCAEALLGIQTVNQDPAQF